MIQASGNYFSLTSTLIEFIGVFLSPPADSLLVNSGFWLKPILNYASLSQQRSFCNTVWWDGLLEFVLI